MITGIGVDTTTISRFEKSYARFGERLARRFLHVSEQAELADHGYPDRFLAKRFAAKEAAVKALGTGEREGVLLRDFYLSHDALGKPLLNVTGKAAEVCTQLGIGRMHISLTDEGNQVTAFVVFEQAQTTHDRINDRES